jgi:hypothetical protein
MNVKAASTIYGMMLTEEYQSALRKNTPLPLFSMNIWNERGWDRT